MDTMDNMRRNVELPLVIGEIATDMNVAEDSGSEACTKWLNMFALNMER